MLEVWMGILVFLGIYYLPYAAIFLFVVRLIRFIVCEDAFESDNRKRKVFHSVFFVGGAVIVRILFSGKLNVVG